MQSDCCDAESEANLATRKKESQACKEAAGRRRRRTPLVDEQMEDEIKDEGKYIMDEK
jgi:hypothetical protein